MLQAVHSEKSSAQASSLYCRWICVERPEGTRLVAVWMDSEMRAFAREMESDAKTEILSDSLADEPGGVRRKGLQGHGEVVEIELRFS
jgi:hypothetical protein